MEPLPRGANFQRALMLWEIGLHIAGDPNNPYYGRATYRPTPAPRNGTASADSRFKTEQNQ